MTSLSRRTFLQCMAATPVALWIPDLAHAAQPRIRYDIASPNGQAMLAVYADAVRLMLQRPQADPRSWLWQWYTHFVDGATTKADEITRIFGTAMASQRTLATEVWNTCQSHSGQNYNHFFPWHRIFLMFHEDIIRNITGRPDFTLPYWNYTSPDPAKRGIVPLQFRLPNDPVWGPLYRPERTFLANSGQRIDKNQPGDQMDISVPMGCTSYSNVGTVMGFCRSIDSGIHGRIHVLSGMGKVPYSGRDPLFFVHHANVDRMWHSGTGTVARIRQRSRGRQKRSLSSVARGSASPACSRITSTSPPLAIPMTIWSQGRFRFSLRALPRRTLCV
jgi:tyrosinase